MKNETSPFLCSECPHMKEDCSYERLRAVGMLRNCPNREFPIINSFGGVLNPPWDERACLDDFVWILFSPQKTEKGWKVKWMLSIHGVGSCGSTEGENYALALRYARTESLWSTRLSDKQAAYFSKLFLDRQYGSLKGWRFRRDAVPEEIEAPPAIKDKEPYVSPFEDWEYGTIGDQLELFS